MTRSIVLVYKKRKPSGKSAARGEDTNMNVSYEAKIQSVSITGKPAPQPTSPSHRYCIQTPTTTTANSAYGVVQKESKEMAEHTYDIVGLSASKEYAK